MKSDVRFGDSRAASVRRVKILARWMDDLFTLPGTKIGVGLDGILGLVPGVGDALTTVVSLHLVGEAVQAGARKKTIMRMLGVIGREFLIGLIPVVGDFFDLTHKSNRRILALLLDDLSH